MAYSNQQASSPIDLLQKIAAWLVSIGWTQDRSTTDGTGWRAHLHLGSTYVNLRAAMSESSLFSSGYATSNFVGFLMYLGTGYDGAKSWYQQPGGVLSSAAKEMGVCCPFASTGAIANAHFFADSSGDNVLIVIERTPGNFGYLGWGSSIEKVGSWTGGAYFYGSRFSADGAYTAYPGGTLSSMCPGNANDYEATCFFRADVDTFVGKWIPTTNETSATYGNTGKLGYCSCPRNGFGNYGADVIRYASEMPSNTSGKYSFAYRLTGGLAENAPLLPPLLWVQRDNLLYALVGSLPNVFYTNAVGKGFAAGQVVQLGADSYMMFPWFAVKFTA